MKWTTELLKDKWIIVNSQEESDQICSFIESFNIPKWGKHTYQSEKDSKTKHNDHVIIFIGHFDYMITQYQLQKSTLNKEDKLTLGDLFPKEDLKSKLIKLFSKSETVFYLKNKEEASRLDKLLKELNYLNLDYNRSPDILTKWYEKNERDKLCMIDLYNFNHRNLDNLKVIELTFDNLLNYVK